jgi:hypothetical protein
MGTPAASDDRNDMGRFFSKTTVFGWQRSGPDAAADWTTARRIRP